MPCEVAETLTSTSSETLARVDTSTQFQVLSSSVVNLTLVCGAGRGVPGLLIADRETPVFLSFPHIMCRFDWSSSFLIMSAQPLCSVKPLKAHFVIPKATSVRKNASFSSSLKKLTLADVWLEYNTGCCFFFLPLFPQKLTQMSFHTSHELDQRSGDQQPQSLLAVQCVLSTLTFDSSVCLACCGVVERATAEKGVFENQGMGMTQQQGVQPEFLLAPLSWEPSGRQSRGRGAL